VTLLSVGACVDMFVGVWCCAPCSFRVLGLLLSDVQQLFDLREPFCFDSWIAAVARWMCMYHNADRMIGAAALPTDRAQLI